MEIWKHTQEWIISLTAPNFKERNEQNFGHGGGAFCLSLNKNAIHGQPHKE